MLSFFKMQYRETCLHGLRYWNQNSSVLPYDLSVVEVTFLSLGRLWICGFSSSGVGMFHQEVVRKAGE